MLDRKKIEAFLAIPKKANKVLQVLSFLLLCIVLRLCYLTICQHDSRQKMAHASMQKIVFEPALRGTIQDRFGITLARNVVEFRASIVWSEIAQEVPRWAVVEGNKKIPLRKKYIQALSKMLSKELDLDPKRIEDVIYSYAVFSHTVPVPLKKGLTEKQFYRLNAKARSWPGLVVERTSRRVYPRGCSACHIVGYTASLGREEYDSIIAEIHALRAFIKAKEIGEEREPPLGITSYFHAKERLGQLERCGYTMFDSVGKAGIEASFDEQLRGVRGFKKYIMNARGDTITLSSASNKALSGKRLLLTISSELQEYAEKILLETEVMRKEWQQETKKKDQPYPFFSGGAIVVLDPKTSEVLALASTPRYDPNDCTKKAETNLLFKQTKPAPVPWFRNDLYAEALWDGVLPVSYEKITPPLSKGDIGQEEARLEWNFFLSLLCPTSSFLHTELEETMSVRTSLDFQKELLSLAFQLKIDPRQVLEDVYEGRTLLQDSLLQEMAGKAKYAKELFLYFDLSRLVLRQEKLSPALESALGALTFRELRHFAAGEAYLLSLLEESAFKEFQKGPFQLWRQVKERQFLEEKRKEEESLKKRGQPYLQYLDSECRRQFDEWWQEAKIALLKTLAGVTSPNQLGKALRHCLQVGANKLLHESPAHLRQDCFAFLSFLRALEAKGLANDFLQVLQPFSATQFELLGTYRMGGSSTPIQTGKELISAIFLLSPPPTLSFAFSQPSVPGSVFKLVTGYAALQQHVPTCEKDPPLTSNLFVFNDKVFKQNGKVFVGFDAHNKPVPQLYKGGRIPKSLHFNIGPIDMVKALETSSNSYFALLADEKLRSPDDLTQAARALGFGEKSGLSLPYEAKGHVPTDLQEKTNLYTTAIGQHTLLATPLQMASMLSTLTTDGSLYVPKLVTMALGRDVRGCRALSKTSKSGDLEALRRIGIDFPLFLEHLALESPYRMFIPKPKCRRKIPLAPEVRDILMRGMDAVIHRLKMTKEALSYDFHKDTSLVQAFIHNDDLVGKSATAETLETVGLVTGRPPLLYNHTWFGAVFFDDSKFVEGSYKEPSLVVVVLLRYGKFGRQAAPLAAAIHAEWKRILERHRSSN